MKMNTKQLQFRYKGDRDYIHGTDLFNGIVDAYSYRTIGIYDLPCMILSPRHLVSSISPLKRVY